jgi:hypothetical protein
MGSYERFVTYFIIGLCRVFCEEVFTTEAQSSQRSEKFFYQELFTPRSPRLRGAISESCFPGKPQAPLIEGSGQFAVKELGGINVQS